MKLVITGSIAYDYLMSFPGRFADHLLPEHLHQVNLSFLVDSMKRERGGNAPNIGYTLGLLRGHPTVMATAGEDFGDYRDWLESHGVDTSAIVEIPGEYCASFFVNTDREQNQIASFYAGAMAYASRLSFRQHAPDADLVIVSPNDPAAMRRYTDECHELGIAYIYDPSQQTVRLSAEDLCAGIDGCRLLSANAYEMRLIEEKTGLDEAKILERCGGLLITLGRAGSTILADGERFDIPSVAPHQATEPTGAGDAFRAGLMRGMQLGLPWDIAGRMGALAATYVLESFGTQSHHFTPADFIGRYRQHFDDEGALDALLR